MASLIAAEIGTGPRGNAGAVVVLQVGQPSRAYTAVSYCRVPNAVATRRGVRSALVVAKEVP